MSFTCTVGDSFFIDDPGGGHRYVVISKPDSKKSVICVNFTKQSNYPNCPFSFCYRDDPIFEYTTVTNYPKATVFKLSFLESWFKTSLHAPYHFNASITQTIIEGAFKSLEDIPIGIARELQVKYPELSAKYPSEIDLNTIDNA